jgi:putative endonuclease
VLARNWLGRRGELDLVLWDRGAVAFVEVKVRTASAWGGGLAAVTFAKQQRIRWTAAEFMRATGRHPDHVPTRFDVIEVRPAVVGRGRRPARPEVTWHQGVFGG